MPDTNNRARDHLANERTFLAWIRTGVATIVFGFAVGRFSIALQEFMQFEKKPATTPGLTAWLGMISIVAGVLLIVAGLYRYRQTRVQIDTDSFEPAGSIIDLVAVLLALFGIVLAGYLAWIKMAQERDNEPWQIRTKKNWRDARQRNWSFPATSPALGLGPLLILRSWLSASASRPG